MQRVNQHGFTLIESVVAVLLLAVMAVLGYQAVETVLSANQRSRADLADEIKLHQAWQVIGNDLLHLRARNFADGLGGIESAYETGKYGGLVDFSRGGGPLLGSNPTGLTRIKYELNDDGELLRYAWPVFLSPRDYEAKARVLLANVKEVVFEQLSRENYFVLDWPPLNENTEILLPRMIKVTIILNDGISTFKLFPGVESDA